MTFKSNEISFYNRVFPFQWDPLVCKTSEEVRFKGSPALMCSDYIQKRLGPYDEKLYASLDEYEIVNLYLNHLINQGNNTVESLNLNLDEKTIK